MSFKVVLGLANTAMAYFSAWSEILGLSPSKNPALSSNLLRRILPIPLH